MAQYQIFLLPLTALALVIFFPIFGRNFSSPRSWRSRRRRRTIVGRIAVFVLLLATLFAVVWPIQGMNTLAQGALASAILMTPVLFIYWISSIKYSQDNDKHRPNVWRDYEKSEKIPKAQKHDKASSPKDKTEPYSIDLSTVIQKKQRHAYRGAASEPSAVNIDGSAPLPSSPQSPSFEHQSDDLAGNTRNFQKPLKPDTLEFAGKHDMPSKADPEPSSFASDIASFADTKIYKDPVMPSPPESIKAPKTQQPAASSPVSADLEAAADNTKIYPKTSSTDELDLSRVTVGTTKAKPPPTAKSASYAPDAAASEDDTKLDPNTTSDTVFEHVPTQINLSETEPEVWEAPATDSETNDNIASPIQGMEFYPKETTQQKASGPADSMHSKPLQAEPEDALGFTKKTASSGSTTTEEEDNVQEHLDKVSSLIQSHDLDESDFMSPESEESRVKTKKHRDRRLKENAALITTSGHNADLTKLSTSQIIQLVANLRRDKNRLQKLVIAQQSSIESERHAHDQTRILTRDAITVMRSARNAQKNAEKLARRERSERQRVEQQYKKIAHALQNAMSIVETRLGEQGGTDDPTSAVQNTESA